MSWVQRLKKRIVGLPNAPFEFFVAEPKRSLTDDERRTVSYLLVEQSDLLKGQLDQLEVVERCGCRVDCPTIFFQRHNSADEGYKLASAQGLDKTGGLVGALLFQKRGVLSQLDIFSIDGHVPWSVPKPETLAPLI